MPTSIHFRATSTSHEFRRPGVRAVTHLDATSHGRHLWFVVVSPQVRTRIRTRRGHARRARLMECARSRPTPGATPLDAALARAKLAVLRRAVRATWRHAEPAATRGAREDSPAQQGDAAH